MTRTEVEQYAKGLAASGSTLDDASRALARLFIERRASLGDVLYAAKHLRGLQ